MDRFQELEIFVAVAEEEGFAAAARRLQMSPPSVTRAISSLESRLGVKLLTRTTRYVRVTDAGERYLEDARQLLAALSTADEMASGVNLIPAGSLAITAPQMFGKLHVVPGIVDYLQRYPETQVSVALLDRVVNLLEEGFDAGIRIGELPDSSMRAIKVGSVRLVVCASPEYLKNNGTPKKPEHLRDHQIVSIGGSTAPKQWRFNHNGQSVSVRVKPRLSVNNIDGAISAVLEGHGLSQVFSYQVEQAIADGKVKLVLGKYESNAMPVHIIHREGRQVSAKLRAFIDVMVERLRKNKKLNP